MSKKPSFFQKLTGANDEENEMEGSENVEMAEEIGEAETHITPEQPKAKIRAKKTEQAEKKPAKTSESGNSLLEEWPTEPEGQLTIDVYQTPSDVIIKSTVAGVNPEDIDIAISNDMVTIRGYRKKDEEIKTEDYYYQECYWGAFSRSVILPVDVETDKVEAGIKNGVLTVRLPKIEKIKTKKIKVKAE